ncbi:MAG: sigma 54-interacting transcriptional regulator [Deltaproteobacteria bacterium]|nr:sigma 54-interacting transcriptional regulator [Deltaproteobacteria bacterium]
MIGRHQTADIRSDDPSLSRRHALFRWNHDRVTVRDLSSRNGTWLRGKKIESAELSSGDILDIGTLRVGVTLMEGVLKDPAPSNTTVPTREDFVVANPKMREIYRQVSLAASNKATVLILGESGTGKEHIALALHSMGYRRNKPFKVINCGSLPRELTESILFGHEKGSFTGATNRSVGLFEQADGGTLFLDEVGELSRTAQIALLRALETQTITRLGSGREIVIDVRVIAATHRQLDNMIESGAFRRDLLYRINTITIEVPPLRERRDEIAPLVGLFLRRASESWGKSVKSIQPEALAKLEQYAWPGNIRQLRNVIERSVFLCRGEEISSDDFPRDIVDDARSDTKTTSLLLADSLKQNAIDAPANSYKERLREREIDTIAEALQRTCGNRRAAARLLHMPPSTLRYKLGSYGIKAKK